MSELHNGDQPQLARFIINVCNYELQKRGYVYSEESISIAKIVELINFAERDLNRIAEDLDNRISREKFAGYHAFWFSKLEPVSGVFRKDGDEHDGEVVDINQRLALQLAIHLLLKGASPSRSKNVEKYKKEDAKLVGVDSPPAPLIWRNCHKVCNGGDCFLKHAKAFLNFHNKQNLEYMINSMRHRPVGPYFIVLLLESMVITGCQEHQEKVKAA